jgi:transposase
MRGEERSQDGLFSYVSLEQRVPQDHPLRAIRRLTDRVLASLDVDFDQLYAATGRPSIAPESMLRAMLLQVFFSIRSERLLSSRLTTTFCFVGLLASAWTKRSGTTRCFRRTATAC